MEGSLQNSLNSGPSHKQMGNREFRQMLTAVLLLSGQVSEGPRGVADQSLARTAPAPTSKHLKHVIGSAERDPLATQQMPRQVEDRRRT
jgi:hypothetical protein